MMCKFRRLSFRLACALGLFFCAPLAVGKSFHFPQDTFAFSNETYFAYYVDATGGLTIKARPPGQADQFSRECFVMTRALLQFHKFAEFRPEEPRLSEEAYRVRIRQLNRIPAWKTGSVRKIVFPGYKDLWTFSRDHPLLLEKNLGNWWATFLRIGNWRMALPIPRSQQASVAQWLKARIDRGDIQTVYMTRFKPLNHCLVAYSYSQEPNGDLIFNVVDVNQPGKVVHLTYRAALRSFYYDRSWYYPGGLVNILKLYISPLT